ncbi:M48 family metalloprotease [Pseudodesulfovibrio sp.]|nr:M48 family metalloprotease [Pseudodesulfovibrio sp.]
MKRRQFLAALAVATPAVLAPSLSWGFNFGIKLPGGLEVDSDKIVDSYKSGKKIVAGFEDITPEQEYYIGRSVAAIVLSKYQPLDHERSHQYVNVMGKMLAQASDRPETFGGYRFLVLDTDEINALSAPGGFIFISKGLLKCCRTEDAMASVLAHEIGHVQRKHGLQAIQKSRITEGVTTLALTGTSTFSGGTLSNLTTAFDGALTDITTTLIDNGYSREFEDEADHDAVTIMQRVGYNPNTFVDMLKVMEDRIKPDGKGFARTHPSPEDRIEVVEGVIGGYTKPKLPMTRGFRFMSMTGGM